MCDYYLHFLCQQIVKMAIPNIIAMSIMFLIATIGIIGNIKLILKFCQPDRRSSRKRNSLPNFNGLTISKATFDILTIFGLIINGIYYEILIDRTLPWHQSSDVFLRGVVIPCTITFGVASIYTTVALSLERYLMIYEKW